MIYITHDLKQNISNSVKPILEEWAGTELVLTSVYGIRLYHNNSWLRGHVDVLQTHAISAIMQIDQDVDEPWALQIVAHDGLSN